MQEEEEEETGEEEGVQGEAASADVNQSTHPFSSLNPRLVSIRKEIGREEEEGRGEEEEQCKQSNLSINGILFSNNYLLHLCMSHSERKLVG